MMIGMVVTANVMTANDLSIFLTSLTTMTTTTATMMYCSVASLDFHRMYPSIPSPIHCDPIVGLAAPPEN